jgi:hypothetical protein
MSRSKMQPPLSDEQLARALDGVEDWLAHPPATLFDLWCRHVGIEPNTYESAIAYGAFSAARDYFLTMRSTPSTVAQRRLRDGAAALAASVEPASTLDELASQIETVSAGIAAMQSLDDLGPEANAQSYRDEQELWQRLKKLQARQAELAAKAGRS